MSKKSPVVIRDPVVIIRGEGAKPVIDYQRCLESMGISFRTHRYRGKQYSMDNGNTWNNVTDEIDAISYAKIQDQCAFSVKTGNKKKIIPVSIAKGDRQTAIDALFASNAFSPLEDWFKRLKKALKLSINPIEAVFTPNFSSDIEGSFSPEELSQYCLDFCLLIGKGIYLRTTATGTPRASFQFLPIVVGPQGCGKGTWVRGLIPNHLRKELTGDCLNLSSGQVDLLESCQRCAVIECSELAGFARREVNFLKSFIAGENVSGRKAFGRYHVTYEKHHIIISTTNDAEFLAKDPTGQRRYPIMPVDFYKGWTSINVKNNMLNVLDDLMVEYWGYIKHLVEDLGEDASYEHWAESSIKIRKSLCGYHERRNYKLEIALDNLLLDQNAQSEAKDIRPITSEEWIYGLPFDAPTSANNVRSIMGLLPISITSFYTRDLIIKIAKEKGWRKTNNRIRIGNSRRYLYKPPTFATLSDLKDMIIPDNIDKKKTVKEGVDEKEMTDENSPSEDEDFLDNNLFGTQDLTTD